jgi:hypothetical protein
MLKKMKALTKPSVAVLAAFCGKTNRYTTDWDAGSQPEPNQPSAS